MHLSTYRYYYYLPIWLAPKFFLVLKTFETAVAVLQNRTCKLLLPNNAQSIMCNKFPIVCKRTPLKSA